MDRSERNPLATGIMPVLEGELASDPDQVLARLQTEGKVIPVARKAVIIAILRPAPADPADRDLLGDATTLTKADLVQRCTALLDDVAAGTEHTIVSHSGRTIALLQPVALWHEVQDALRAMEDVDVLHPEDG